MSIMQRTASNGDRIQVLETIVDDGRRRTLDALLGRSSPATLDDLVDHLASVEEHEEDASGHADASDDDVATHRVALAHVYLPALEAADLVEWDRDAGTVTATDHPALADPTIRRILGGDGDGLDAVVDTLANERRRTVLTVLEGRTEPTSRWALALEIAGRDASGEPSNAEIEETLVALHHRDLPKLDDAGLVSYDVDEETVTYRGHPGLDP